MKARAVHNAEFDDGEEAQNPKAEEDVEIAEVGEADDRGQDAKVNGGKVAGEVDLFAQVSGINGDARQARGEITEDIPGEDAKNSEKPRPENFVAKYVGDAPGLVKARGEFYGKLREWKGESLVVFPLALEDNTRAQSRCKTASEMAVHQNRGCKPAHPGDGMRWRQSIVERTNDRR